ncbi:hypothetical protein [Massilia psychrophila]|uniref:hypothetical protein n=1 Tax=Massilia psychrophila TaxID=1603353 RepID=UPI00117C23A0|nr:hypothetical protein [Massilia psychrophila]GGE82051.1 hypothetical protein GCM10008020_28720 [Massilia psychrophila]
MASIIKRERKNKEPAWQVQIRLPNCKSVMKTFDTEETPSLADRFARLGASLRKANGQLANAVAKLRLGRSHGAGREPEQSQELHR